MSVMDTRVLDLLKRTNFSGDFNEYIRDLSLFFPQTGVVGSVSPITEGYEDANFLLDAENGKYVLKIFSKGRSKKNIRDYAKVIIESQRIGFPTAKPISVSNPVYVANINGRSVYSMVTEFFDGRDFKSNTPTPGDLEKITFYLSKLNTLNFEVKESYDSWGNKNLYKEYLKADKGLTVEQKQLIVPVVEEFLKIKFSGFSKSLIHGDMQRKHVLKNSAGKYCILDFGCMSYGAKVTELSTYLAWFCLQEDTWSLRENIYKKVVQIYTKIHKLSSQELSVLPTLTYASYASYFLKTSLLIKNGDKSEETLEWHNCSEKMLGLFKKYPSII